MAVVDWWIDAWILDWVTLRRISSSRERLGQVLEAVKALESRLQQAAGALESENGRDRRLLEDRLGP